MKFTTVCCPKWLGFVVCSALLLSSLAACKDKTPDQPAAVESEVQDTLPQDFKVFFDRFHEDTAFQLAHIIFPLEGLPNSQGETDTVPTMRYFWQQADWKYHHHLTDPSNQFDNWFEVLDPRIIEHWVNAKGTNLFMHRRFAKLNDGWYLIYYAGMRPNDEKASTL
jgi:hypothetical protein